jgi:putative cardiolipin synthase
MRHETNFPAPAPGVKGGASMDAPIAQTVEDRLAAGQSGLLLVDDNDDALAVRILAARSAVTTLDLMYYILRSDQSGRLLLKEVVAAADRGVKVRLLIDDINPQSNDEVYLALNSHPSIELRLFNPAGLRNGSLFRWLELVSRAFALTRRMHAKAFIADRRYAIVGGRNIGDEYFGSADTNFRDLDMLMLGKAVDDTVGVFERYWSCDEARPLQLLHPTRRPRSPKPLRRAERDAGEVIGTFSTIADFIAGKGEMLWTNEARVIADPPEKVRGRNWRSWLMRELMPLIQSATTRLEIVSPYFIPGRKGSAVLAGLVARGVSVKVLTNSLASTDVAAVHGAYANYRKRLLRAGVALYEFQPSGKPQKMSVFGSKGASLHTKAFTVDDRIGFIGSLNFDPRSVSLNAEMGVVFEDERLVARLNSHFAAERDPDASYRLTLDGGRIRWNRSDGEEKRRYGEPKASVWRRLLAFTVRFLPIESQL